MLLEPEEAREAGFFAVVARRVVVERDVEAAGFAVTSSAAMRPASDSTSLRRLRTSSSTLRSSSD